MLNYANNKNAFIRKESNDRFGFKVASEILRHDQHTAIPGGRIREIQFLGLRTLTIFAQGRYRFQYKRPARKRVWYIVRIGDLFLTPTETCRYLTVYVTSDDYLVYVPNNT